MAIAFERISDQHQVAGFVCDKPEMQAWLVKRALKNDRLGLGNTTVAIDTTTGAVVGYFTICASTVTAQIRAAGATPVFVVTPIIFQTTSRFRQTPPPAPIIAFNDARKYPQFYDVKVRIDDGHLTRPAAEDFCRALAAEFVRDVRHR